MLDSKHADVSRFDELLHARHTCIRIETDEERHARGIVDAAATKHVEPYWIWSATRGLRAGLLADPKPVPDTEHPAAALYHLAHQSGGPAICLMLDLLPHLTDDRTLRALRDTLDAYRQRGGTLILLDHASALPPVIAAEATPFEISLPDQEELRAIIRRTVREAHRENEVTVKLSRKELNVIIRNLSGLNRQQARQIILDTIVHDRQFDAEDINTILAHKRQRLHHDGLLEYVEAPVDSSSIGGLRKLKRWLKDREHSFDDDARTFGLTPPRGVLLLGVQGAGKSLSAKAVASAWQRPLLRLDPGALYDRYVGESEKRLRDALHQAEAMSPIVLWIDEIEKGFASAATRSTDGGLSQRMFGTLLTWMQEHRSPVFLIATANNIDALPPELLRKGRFDEIFFVDLPNTAVRRQIFTIHLRQRDRDPGQFDLDALAGAADGYSGAEIEQAIVSALHTVFARDGSAGTLTTKDVLASIEETVPLSRTMHERVVKLRAWARERCTPAD